MGNNVVPRFNLYFLRADRPFNSSVASAFLGAAPLTFAIGVPQLLSSASELSSDRVINCQGHLAGPTSGRPNALTDYDFSAPPTGIVYFDTTLSQAVVYDGANWRNVFTGAIA